MIYALTLFVNVLILWGDSIVNVMFYTLRNSRLAPGIFRAFATTNHMEKRRLHKIAQFRRYCFLYPHFETVLVRLNPRINLPPSPSC
jgi:hypothetical protein